MYWIDEAVEDLLKANPDKQNFVCASGISPSGSVHIGNFREFITTYFVCEGLKKAGKNVRFYLSWDNYDRLRKIPANVREVVGDSFDKYIGVAYDEIPDPFGCHKTWAKHFEAEFEQAIEQLNIKPEYIYQADMYRNGKYVEQIIKAVKHRFEIYDILYQFKEQEATAEGREQYVPVNIYCSKCKHDSTQIYKVSDDCEKLSYKCSNCGNDETIDLRTYRHVKLPWKVDWPMRWAYENVDFEPGGKDHGTPGSSYTVGEIIVDKIYGKTAPQFVIYEFVGIKGMGGKISSSTGGMFTPLEVLRVCPPEMLLWLFARVNARQSWNICLDEDILRQYNEFDRMVLAYQKPDCPENIKKIIEYAYINSDIKSANTISAQLLASLGPIVNFEPKLVLELFKRLDKNVNEKHVLERLDKIKYWMTTYSPESEVKLLTEKNAEFYETLTQSQKQDIKTLVHNLQENEYGLDELQQMLYAIAMREGKDKKENVELQKTFFENVYSLLIGKKSGPRLYLFLGALEKENYIDLLTF